MIRIKIGMKNSILIFIVYCTLICPCYLKAQSPGWQWAQSAEGAGEGRSSSVDVFGNIYLTGMFSGKTIIFGIDTLTNHGQGVDIFLVKYNPNGNILWAKSAGGYYNDDVRSVSSDPSGNVFIAGFFDDTITFGANVLICNGYRNVFLAKYDPDGNVLWAKSAGGMSYDMAFALSASADASGNAYITGDFASPAISFGSFSLTNSYPGNAEIFIVKFNPGGNVLWAKCAGGVYDDFGLSVAVDTLGNTYVTGESKSYWMYFDSIELRNYFNDNIFLVKYNSDGNAVWAKSAGGISPSYGTSVTIDNAENVYVTGCFSGPKIIFGQDTLWNTTNTEFFLARFDSFGNAIWAKNGVGNGVANSVTITAKGIINQAGMFGDPTLTIGQFTLDNSGSNDVFLAQYDINGNVLWAGSANGTGWDEGTAVSADTSGNCYLSGYFRSPALTIGPFILTNNTSYGGNVFISKLFDGTVGIKGTTRLSDLSIFPNPVSDLITIMFTDESKSRSISLYNLNGRILNHYETDDKTIRIDMRQFNNGVYFVKCIDHQSIVVRKVIKL